MAAVELARVAWRGEERSSAEGSGSRRSLGKQELAVGSAAQHRRAEKAGRERGER